MTAGSTPAFTAEWPPLSIILTNEANLPGLLNERRAVRFAETDHARFHH